MNTTTRKRRRIDPIVLGLIIGALLAAAILAAAWIFVPEDDEQASPQATTEATETAAEPVAQGCTVSIRDTDSDGTNDRTRIECADTPADGHRIWEVSGDVTEGSTAEHDPAQTDGIAAVSIDGQTTSATIEAAALDPEAAGTCTIDYSGEMADCTPDQ